MLAQFHQNQAGLSQRPAKTGHARNNNCNILDSIPKDLQGSGNMELLHGISASRINMHKPAEKMPVRQLLFLIISF